MFCTNCGNELSEDSIFCTECGAKVTDNNVNKSTPPEQVLSDTNKEITKTVAKKSGKRVIVIAATAVILAAVGIGFAVKTISNNVKDITANTTEESKTTDNTVVEELNITENVATEEDVEITMEELEKETVESAVQTKDEYEALVADVKTQDAIESDMYQTLYDLSQVLVGSKIIGNQGDVLTQLSDDAQWNLDYKIMKETLFSNNIFQNQLKWDDYSKCSVKELEQLISEIYGGANVSKRKPAAFAKISGDDLEITYGDGDPWHIIESADIKKKDNYYLLTAPYFYGDNGGKQEYLGYIDVLFVENDESRFGVTMLYAQTYNDVVQISRAEVSSQLSSQEGKNYDATNLFDGDYTTAWVEGVDGLGVDETITLYFDEAKEIHGLWLLNGYLASTDLYDKNGKVTKIEIQFSHEESAQFAIDVNDDISSQSLSGGVQLSLSSPIVTDRIVITIKDAVGGSKYEDVCISEIIVY